MIGIFDLRFGQCRFFDNRPHHGFRAEIKRPIHQEFQKLPDDMPLRIEAHRRIRTIPVAFYAKPFEPFALNADPLICVLPAFFPKLIDGNLVLVFAFGSILFFNLPFDRQPVAIPAGDIVGVLAHHLLGLHHHVLKNLIERMPHMNVAIGVRGAIMKDELFPAFGLFPQQPVQIHGRPAFQVLWFRFRQTGFHGKVRFRKKKGRFVVQARICVRGLFICHIGRILLRCHFDNHAKS